MAVEEALASAVQEAFSEVLRDMNSMAPTDPIERAYLIGMLVGLAHPMVGPSRLLAQVMMCSDMPLFLHQCRIVAGVSDGG